MGGCQYLYIFVAHYILSKAGKHKFIVFAHYNKPVEVYRYRDFEPLYHARWVQEVLPIAAPGFKLLTVKKNLQSSSKYSLSPYTRRS